MSFSGIYRSISNWTNFGISMVSAEELSIRTMIKNILPRYGFTYPPSLFNWFMSKWSSKISSTSYRFLAIYFHILSDLSRHFGILMMIYRRIISILGKQLVMSSLLNDPAVIQHKDLVCISYRRNTVCDNKRGTAVIDIV